MGELLIDFIPNESGQPLSKVKSFSKMAGGAPANVSACFSKLGGKAYFMGQVGHDPFGNYLIDVLNENGVDIRYISQTKLAKTSLAFVSLDHDGERDFMFYRDPSADQLFEPKQVEKSILEHAVLHFCSVGLKDYPLKHAHVEAIKQAKKFGSLISFDPNLRFALWENHDELRRTVLSFIPHAHILKLSLDELYFLAETNHIDHAIKKLFMGSVKMILITDSKNGATLYVNHLVYQVDAFHVDVVDTTGAGDAFIGAFLYQYALYENHTHDYEKMLEFAAATAALTVSNYGAIPSLPTLPLVMEFLKKNR
jgi:fructokinase